MKILYNKFRLIIILAVIGLYGCADDFLERLPIDDMTDENFWTSENNLQTFSYDFYPHFFEGYGNGWTWGNFFSGESLNDDFGPSQPSQFVENVPTSGGGWNFDYVRRANLFIERIPEAPLTEEAEAHWLGVARFFRGMEYARLVRRFGDVPYFDRTVSSEDKEELYRPRESRVTVMQKVLEDFEFAAENVRKSVDNDGLEVNRGVVLAFMSRIFLWEGTWQKYHDVENEQSVKFLEAARDAADMLMSQFDYQIVSDYRGMFNSLSLSGNQEVILYRSYESGVVTHCLHTYNAYEPQTGASKDLLESYLALDGLPVDLSSQYQGDDGIDNVMANRDPRIHDVFVDELRINGVSSNYSTTGYATHKFLNEDIIDDVIGTNAFNPTDAPIIRFGEVLLNYVEACAELGELTQDDLDRSINQLRRRYPDEVRLPDLELIGDEPAVNGVVFDDPKRDEDVSSIIWEIRRERRIELVFEGFRNSDLRRWKKLEYTDTRDSDINRGAYIKASDYPDMTNVVIEDGAEEGYIVPAYREESQRRFNDERVYLFPLPVDQIALYRDNGFVLEQNPGWE
ncbi:RagB/SusD family nutrient uptake outer membrane protein [Marinilabiliaceae bacterium ANBcel2]|nr:RagB/SusD family nutrient uptake outer membrane protein [Marinilabiliaceae bacterium ANBcel2]